jgi:hypothetical protein
MDWNGVVMISNIEIELQVYEARVAYISSAIAEINAVCNVMASTSLEHCEACQEIAQNLGNQAQQKFNEYRRLLIEKNDGVDIIAQMAESLATPLDGE